MVTVTVRDETATGGATDQWPFISLQGRTARLTDPLGLSRIMIEPHSDYLCIVPARGSIGPLPFEADPIPSTAIMLAVDDTITDTTVLRQLAS
ncbi:hypothetical protein GA0070216_108182 [Micromonospora matsumotoense]|uniref:DUF7737 domain-containing protein n=2 Tax=Micromonospora matsumotoense TaxID=121616 RepID=A0A1C4Z5P5_9ACTN|nr:hypothetical protein GA0070216_108182 [Micromonospora matsumotoense]